jgi:DNA polymerase (family X)
MMNNRQLADTFTLIANLLEIKGEIIYKTLAYRKASESLMSLGREASEYWKEGKLEEIPGVGKAIAEKIDEFFPQENLDFSKSSKRKCRKNWRDGCKCLGWDRRRSRSSGRR